MRIRFATQSYRLDSLKASAQRCVNAYAERQPPDAKTDVKVTQCPGIVEFATCGSGPVRGGHEMGGIPYVVSGTSLYSFSDTGTVTQLGVGITGNGPVSMDDNGTQLCVTNGTNGYIYSDASGFQLISDSDFRPANTNAYIDSFFAFDRAGTQEYFICDSGDGTAFSDFFSSAETKSDNLLAVRNHLQVLHLFGARSIEMHANVGKANFPFERIPGGVIARGIAAPYATAVEDQSVFLMGDDKVAYRLNGNSPVRISTFSLEQAWEGYATIADVHAMAWSFGGHKFINFNFPTANASIAYDISSGLWHERVSYDIHGNSLGRWRGNCTFPAYGRSFVGDRYSGKVGYLDANAFTEFGVPIRIELISPPVHGDGKRIFMPWFELDVQTGVGITSGQGENPQYMLDVSDDGGQSWDAPQVWQSAGRIGQTTTRLLWGPLGSTEGERVLRVTCSDPVAKVILAARCPELETGV